MHQQTAQKTASWGTLALTLVVLGCGEAATGPEPGPDPNPQVGNVSIEPNVDPIVAVGYTAQLTATVTNTDGSVVSGASVSWNSSDAQIAVVSGSGLVTGLRAGQATITATYNGVGGSLALTVLNADLETIAQLRDDPLVSLLIARLDSNLAAGLTAALNELDAAVTVGHCIAVRDALESAMASVSGSTNSDDVVSLAVLGLVLERAQRLLGL